MKRNNYKIGVFDSGIGGLSTLKEIRKSLPNENYVYLADTKNNPYGNKTQEELFIIAKNAIEKLIKKNVKTIVIACNTASTNCINELRKQYPDMIFIGTEPAIKLACDKGYKNILLLVTPLTAKSDRLFEIINNNVKDDIKLSIVPCFSLADTIESKDKKRIKFVIYKLLYDYKDYNYDSIVLGSTHYCHIKKELKELFENATLLDGNKGVSKELKRKLNESNLFTDRKTKGKVEYIN